MKRTGTKTVVAWGMLLLAILAWAGCVYLYLYLDKARFEYADRAILAEQEVERQESSARLRALVQGTEVERAALESVVGVRIVDAAETIEVAMRDAGTSEIQISEANAGSPNTQGISNVSMGVSAAGSFAAVMRAVLLLESLPLPSTLEQFELAQSAEEWRINARLKLTLANVQ